MRLLALQLLGFKSFPDKTELRFGPGITAVVGPNGSGKSNIVDAIRWVLGEASGRALRTPRATDLIFAGTSSRKPLGMAQVTLILDNADQALSLPYAEVSLTRRIYRSGESEFLINGQPCRLRDIQELLLGTGLGRGGMAIVGQGEIDAVLSADPRERRLLLEETAGTSRYRAQKREAVQKLSQAQADLDRVRDMVVELTQRHEGLQAQARAAARYRELVQALREARACQAAREWLAAAGRLKTLQAEAQQAQQALLEAEAAWERTGETARAFREQAASAQAELQKAERERQEAEARLAAVVHELDVALVKRQAAERQMASLDGEMERRQKELAAARDELARVQEELSLARQRAQVLRSEAAATQRELAVYDAQHREVMGRLEAARSEALEVLQRLAHQRNETRRLESELASLAAKKARLGDTLDALAKEQDEWRKALGQALGQLQERESRLKDFQRREAEASKALKQAETHLAELVRSAAGIRSRLEEARAARRAILRLEDNLSGYQPAVKAVLQADPPLAGIRGTVAQLMEVPTPFEAAIQAALGAALQYVVVDDQAAVKAAIEHLRARRAGRATFLPLDTLRARRWPGDLQWALSAPGVAGRAADLVNCAQDVQVVAEHLLGRILVVETLERAMALSRELPAGVRLVSKTGDLIVPGGPVTGGSTQADPKAGLLARRRELREWEERQRSAQRELEQAQQQLAAAQEDVEALKGAVARYRTAAQQETLALERARHAAAALEKEGQRLEKAAALHRAEQEEVRQTEAATRERLAQAQAELRELEAREGDLRQALHHLTEKGRREEEGRRRRADALAEARSRLAAREEAVKSLEREASACRRRLDEHKAALDRMDEERRALAADLERLVKTQAELEERMPRAREEARRAQEREAQAAARVSQVRQAADAADGECARARLEAERCRERVWRVQADEARVRAQADNLAQRLAELGSSCEEAEKLARAPLRSSDDIRRLEQELEALGGVHLGAEEELEEVGSRLAFLREQQADLERATSSLTEAIARLDRVCEERFARTLEQVRRSFLTTFRRLFGDGEARLELTGEGGVDVHVKLPGKRSQNLLALSGGERALVAIALLFAMLDVQPSPFYVLDEIDAALDEANLVRFQALLRQAAETAQFIVITHRATTMEAAGVLYGVTAAQPGVSTLISLDLARALATTA
ncbi:MAG: chromosome segregation protein SMC [Firmicutes bacterium]|nr:chromosome segregation protein SMC [Bacillota bacterium]